jgi:hypothetical protein
VHPQIGQLLTFSSPSFIPKHMTVVLFEAKVGEVRWTQRSSVVIAMMSFIESLNKQMRKSIDKTIVD